MTETTECFDTKLRKVKFLKHQHELDKFHDFGNFLQAFEKCGVSLSLFYL